MKSAKQLISIVSAVLLLLSFTACSGNKENESSQESESVASSESTNASGITGSDSALASDVSADTESATTKENGTMTTTERSTTNETTGEADSNWSIGVEDYTTTAVTTRGLSENTVYKINMNQVLSNTTALNHDIWRLFSSLQGVMNRDYETTKIMLYLDFDDNDGFWLQYMMGTGKFLNGYTVKTINTLEDALSVFKYQIQDCGLAVWDGNVPATANVAATACGIYNYLPIRMDTSSGSLYEMLLNLGANEKMNYVGMFTGTGTISGTSVASTGSAKNDAYYWALINYMSKCSTEYLAYMPDGGGATPGNTVYENESKSGGEFCSIPNHDYLIANRAFFFDLTPVASEVPCDDPNQTMGTDRNTLEKILETQYQRNGGGIIYTVGFLQWQLKYTSYHNYGSVPVNSVETMLNDLLNSYNCTIEADAAHPCWMTNASAYMHYPIRSTYENNTPSQTLEYDSNTVYLLLYVGDFDSSAWLKYKVQNLFGSSNHDGSVPLMWNFDPNLVSRAAPMFDYIYEHKTSNDFFATGNSGCGNMNPSKLFGREDKEDGGTAWYNFCKKFYDLFNENITGFLINGADPLTSDVMSIYSQLSPVGVFHNDTTTSMRVTSYNGTPFVHLMNGGTATEMYSYLKTNIRQGYNYAAFRVVVSTYDEIINYQNELSALCEEKDSSKNYVWVDPYNFFSMVKASGQMGTAG